MIAPHRAVELPGLHAYADQISVEAGQQITLHVSADRPYSVSLCRLGPDLDSPAKDEVLEKRACPEPRLQPIHPGSYAHVPCGLPAGPVPQLTFEGWLKVWSFRDWQCVFSQMEQRVDAKGIGLFVDPEGYLAFGCSVSPDVESDSTPGLLKSPAPISLKQWVHVAAVIDHERAEIWLDGTCVARTQLTRAVSVEDCPIRLGACGLGGVADMFLEGDLAMPTLYGSALDAADMAARVQALGVSPVDHPDVLACWPLNELTGTLVRDSSPNERHGSLVNHGTRVINGPAFDPSTVPRYRDDPSLHFEHSAPPDRAGLRFASDDLVDCDWEPTHVFHIPENARSGLYVARFEYALNGKPARYDVTFVVKRNRQAPAPKLLVLCATNSWLAYAATPFAASYLQPATWPRRCTGLPNSHPLAPQQCVYSYHHGGQPTYYAGTRMPRPHTAPYEKYDPAGSGFAQWTRLERELHTWLDSHDYEYDLIADIDLHRSPSLLNEYSAVIINGHSEYWSEPARNGLEKYLDLGGHAIVLSGNSMYWRVSFDESGHVMEQRKTRTVHDGSEEDGEDVMAPAGPHGEQYHSQDGRRGGLWRFAGRPSTEAIGLETAGWGFAEAQDFGVYKVGDVSHALFNTPFATELKNGDTFGHGPDGSLPRAIGHEWDLTTATLMRMTPHIPHDADVPEPQKGITVIAQGVRDSPGKMDAYLGYFETPTKSLDGLSCEMIVWDRPAGGRVFNAGAVGASWVLGVDEKMGRLLANVLNAFAVPYPSEGPYMKKTESLMPVEST
ncbi:N,N-dimethylformamidase beta subunit family domain-containing protein [Ottowia thiooxydans]|uniref:N,N-dimethylformamidase beta subunit family domain-containing protein n=1 Tax=Ottowia thiooxydans TaxID=219182 RepID=UPI00041EEB98|nr:N,N-dimethylformamidase beta subunit family domain-containing protein [Ottowia thiooxydans]